MWKRVRSIAFTRRKPRSRQDHCTDCGACALVCPESAIAPAAEFGRYVDASAPKKRIRRETHVGVVPTKELPDETPAYQIILNEWVDTFVASHV